MGADSRVADDVVDEITKATSIVDEVLEVCERRGISAMPDNADVAFPEPPGADRG